MGNDLDKLYKALIGKGYSTKDIGDADTFRAKMADKGNRKQLYDYVSSRGDFRIGDYDTYEKRLAPTKEAQRRHQEGSEAAPSRLGGGTYWEQQMKAPDWRSEDTKLKDEMATSGKATPVTREGEEIYPAKPIEVYYDEAVDELQKGEVERQRQQAAQKEDAAARLKALSGEIGAQVDAIPRRIPRQFEGMRGLTDEQHEENRLRAAQRLVEDAEETVAEAGKKGSTNFFAGLGRGVRDKIADAENWDFGFTDLGDNKYLLDALRKSERGEQLTPAEDKLLEAATTNMIVGAYYSPDLGRGYKAGQVTAESLPFMLEFVANPISASGSSIAKSLLRYGMKKFGGNVVNRAVPRAAGRLFGDAVAATGMAATTGAPRVLAGTYERLGENYNSQFDDTGNVQVEKTGDMSAGEALARSFSSTVLGNQSEMIFAPLAGGGKLAKEALAKYIPYISKLSDNSLVRFYNQIKNAPIAKDLRERAKIGGVFEEYGEEVYNNLANVAMGEMSAEEALSLDTNIDTFLGLVPTQLAFSAIGVGGLVRENISAKRRLNAFTESLSEDEKELFAELRDAVQSGDTEIPRDFIKVTLADANLTDEQRKERIFAVKDMVAEKKSEDLQAEEAIQAQEQPAISPEEIQANKIDTYRNWVRAQRKVSSLGIPQEILDGMTVQAFVNTFRLDDAQVQAVAEYKDAQQRYGQYEADLNTRMEAERQRATQQAEADVERFGNKKKGAIVQARMIDEDTPVYIYDGDVVYYEDGIKDKERSSDTIYYTYVDAEGNTVRKQAYIDNVIEVTSTTPAEEYIAQHVADTEAAFMQQEQASLQSPDIDPPYLGAPFTVDGLNFVISQQDPDGGWVASLLDEQGGLVGTMHVSDQEYYDAKEAELWGVTPPQDQSATLVAPKSDIGGFNVPLSPSLKGREAEEALGEVFRKGTNAVLPEKIATEQEFEKEFSSPIRTVLGELVNVGKNVFNKLVRRSRENISGAIRPTLEDSDFVIKDTDGTRLYVKLYKNPDGTSTYNVTVVNKRGEVEDYISSAHIKSDNNLINKIKNGAELFLPSKRTPYGAEAPNNPTPPVGSKGNEIPQESQAAAEETPAQRLAALVETLPKKKDGTLDYRAMTPQQQYQYTSLAESPDVAAEDLLADVEAKRAELGKMQQRLAKATGGERAELRDKMREANRELSELEAFYQSVAPAQPEEAAEGSQEVTATPDEPENLADDEEYMDWVAENSDDAVEVAQAYALAKEAASHEATLKPWQRELLGRKISTASFNRFGDRNHITGTLAKGWLRRDGEELDTLAQELSGFGQEVSEQDIIDFMLQNPSNHVSQRSEEMRKLATRFSEIASAEMGFPVGGPESNTGRLYLSLKEANQKLTDLSEQQKQEARQAIAADMQDNSAQLADIEESITDEYAAAYDAALQQAHEDEADVILAAQMEETAEPLYDGMTADELDEIYSSLEYKKYGTERQDAGSIENPAQPLQEGTGESQTPDDNPDLSATDRNDGETDSGTEQPETGAGALTSRGNDVYLQSSNQTTENHGTVSEPVPQGERRTETPQNTGMEEAAAELRTRIEASAGNAQASGRTLSERQKQEIEQRAAESYAKETGVWIPMSDTFAWQPMPSGNENNVYLNTEDGHVYKVNNLMNSKGILPLFERINLHNQLFPSAKYEFVGFTGFDNGSVYPVFKQEYVNEAEAATPEEIDTYMQSLGFRQTGEAEYSNGNLIISDLRPRNVLRDADGDMYVVDAEFKEEKTEQQPLPVFQAPAIEQGENIFDYAARVAKGKDTDDMRRSVNTSPTEAQKEAGNYKKGHVKVDGYHISIENPKGSTRSGKDAQGNEWSVTMQNDYGYIRGTKAVDGDHIDVFLSDTPEQGNVYVVDQIDQQTGEFDESKVMYGFNSLEEARDAYLSNYSPGWKAGHITEVSKEEFKKWIDSSTEKRKAFSEYKSVEKKKGVSGGSIDIDPEPVGKQNGTAPLQNALSTDKGSENKSGNKQDDGKSKVANPSGNRLVTDERYAELKERMRKKLGGQLNVGIDPEILAIGTEMAVYHIEKGARKFADYAKAMIEDLGDVIRPYLKAFYNGARELPEVEESGFASELTPYDEVRKFDTANLGKPVMDVLALAQTIADEQVIGKQADEVRQEIINHRNDERGKVAKKYHKTNWIPRNEPPGVSTIYHVRVNTDGSISYGIYRRAERGLIGGDSNISVEEFEKVLSSKDLVETDITYGYIEQEDRDADAFGRRKRKASAKDKLIDQHNEQRRKEDEQATADTTAIASQAESDIEAATTEQQVNNAVKSNGKIGRNVRKKKEKPVFLRGETVNDLFNQNLQEDEPRNQTENRSLGRGAREEDRGTGTRRESSGVHGRNVSDQDGSRGVHGSTGTEQPVTPKQNTRNFHFGESGIDVPAGEIGKLKANIEAIRTLKELEESGEPAIQEQKAKLSRYVGWGGLANALDENEYRRQKSLIDRYGNESRNYTPWGEKFYKYHDELKQLLTPEEFRSAIESTTTSHYTPEEIIKSLWDIVQRAGFKGGTVSEPALGIGHILGFIPESISDNSRISGFELDALSGRIAAALYPDARIKVQGYETEFAPKSKDLVITNVPFAKEAPYDKALDKAFRKQLGSSYNLHNYFILKSLLELKEGGLGVFVTSSATMDGVDSRFREYVSGNGIDLVGAIRLPNDAFLKNAGTSVTADVLVFRKRKAGEPGNGIRFTSTTQIGEGTYQDKGETRTKPIMVNEYFAEHPDMMLGEMMTAYDAGSGGLYSGASQTLKAKAGTDLGKALREAVERLPENILADSTTEATPLQREQTDMRNGQLVAKNGKVFVSENGELVPVPGKDFKHNGQVRKVADAVDDYNAIKATLKELIAEEQKADGNPEPLRKKLNELYDGFVSKYGTLNRNKALDDVFAEDVEHNLPLSLETVKRVPSPTGKSMVYVVEKAKGILTKRISYPVKEPKKAESLQDAINISQSYRGMMDVSYISQLLGISEEEAADQLLEEGVAYRDPITGELQDKDSYLSGNVREKLEVAIAAAESNPEYKKNVDDLTEVQPETVRFGDISFRLGTPWIPTEHVNKFAEEVLGITNANVSYMPSLNEFVLGKGAWVNDFAKSGMFSTERMGVIDLLDNAINQRKPRIYDERTEYGPTGKTTVRIPNEAETQAVAEKIMEISDKFIEYIEGRKDLHRELERIYNDRYNNYRLKEYRLPAFATAGKDKKGNDVTIIHYPNSNEEISLREHQAKAVQRSLSESTLLAHQVGTGKTFTMITTAMEMRRLGIANKPMIVVQNATLEDFVRDFYKLYPGANVLAPSKDERSAENRKRLFNLIATGDFDAIVIPQSFLQFIPDDEGRKKQLIQKRIAELEEVLTSIDESGLRRRLEREIEGLRDSFEGVEKKRKVKDKAKAASRIKAKMERQLDRRTDDVMTFEQMGIDALFIDEAHNFKKIGFASKMGNVKGVDTGASQRANSLLLKAKWVQEKNGGRNVVLATGTPITNTMAEVWTMMNFVAPEILDAYHINSFDDFATTFGIVEPSLEFTATGNFKIADRFKSYVNVPELVKAFRSHTDVVLTEDVKEFKEKNDIPKLKDGKMTNIVIDKNEDLEDVMQTLINRLEEYNNMSGKEKREWSALPLVVFTKAKQAAIDLRLLNPSYPDNPNSKTNQVVNNIVKLYKESTPDKGTQLVFCDSYQSPGEQPKMDLFDYNPDVPRFNLYEDIREKLIAQGIPANEIAIINNYDGERRKTLFEKVRNGDVRVLLGSTEKMGVGVNVQDRLYALHHIDAPIRPMDFEQRNGRILRQGNLYAVWDKPVNVVTYGVQGTLDATAYDRLRIKQAFINQMMKGNVSGRVMEEQDEDDPSGMTFSQMAATLSGDKTAQLLFAAQNKLKRLRNLKRSDANSKSAMGEGIESARNRIILLESKKKVYERAYSTVEKYFPEGVTDVNVNGRTITEKIGTELDEIISAHDEKYSLNRGIAPLKMSLNKGNAEVVIHYNEGRMVYELYAGGEHVVEGRQFNGGRGLMSSIEHQLKATKRNLDETNASIEELNKRIEGLTEAMNAPWGREDELKEAEREVEKLQKQLEEKAAENSKKKDVAKSQEDVRFREGEGTEEVNERFNTELERLTEDNADKISFDLGMPSDVLLSAGVEDMRMKLYGNKVIKKMKKHGFKLEELRDLPKAVANPIAVFKNYGKEGNRSILTELKTEQGNFLVTLSVGKGNDLDFNIVSSVFGKNRDSIADWINKGYATYMHKEKTLDYLHHSALKAVTSDNREGKIQNLDLDSTTKIVETFENPKLPVENLREGEGSYSDEDLSLANDPFAKFLGKPRRSKKQQAEYAERERRRMTGRARSLAEQLGLDNVEIVTDASTLEGRKARAKGFFDPKTGKITVVIPNHTNSYDVEQTLLHEAVAHYGLRRLFGEHFDTFLDNVYNNASPEVKERIDALVDKYNGNVRTATEEYLASLAENTDFENAVRSGWFDEIKQFFLRMLAKAGVSLPSLTDNELRYILWRSYENLAHPGHYRNVFDTATDVAKQYELKVGNYAEAPARGNTAAEGAQGLKAERIEKLRNSKPVEITGNEIEPSDDLKQYKKNALEYGKKLQGSYTNKDTGRTIQLQRGRRNGGINEVLQHDYKDVEHLQSIAAIPQIIEDSIYIDSRDNIDADRNPDVREYQYYVCGLKIANLDYTVRSTIAVDKNGNRYYDHKLTRIEKGKLLDLINSQTAYDNGFGATPSTKLTTEISSNYKDKVLISILQENEGESTESNAESEIEKGTLIDNIDALSTTFDNNQNAFVSGIKDTKPLSILQENGEKDAGILYRENGEVDTDGTIQAYEDALNTWKFKAREAYQDSMLALKELQDVVEENSGRKLKSFENAYMAENQMSSKSTREAEVYGDNFFKPMLKSISNLVDKGMTYDIVKRYVMAKHGLERNEVFARRDAAQTAAEEYQPLYQDAEKKYKEGELSEDQYKERLSELDELRQAKEEEEYNKNRERDYSGLSSLMEGEEDYETAASEFVEEFEKDNDVTELWNAINDATGQTLRKSYESGMMSKNTYDRVRSQFKYYVPLRGWNEETAEDVYEYLASETSPVNSVLKTAKGRTSISDDPFAVIGNMAESAILQGNRNLMKQNFMNMAINHPSALLTVGNVWYVQDMSTGEWTVSMPDIQEGDSAEEVSAKIEEHKKRMNELAKEGMAQKKKGSLDINYRIGKRQAREHAVIVKKNGEDYVVYVNGNPRAAQAVNGMTNPDAESNWIFEGISRFNRWMAANFTTRNPAFVLSNLFRDLIFSMSAVAVKENKEYAAAFAKNIPSTMKAIARGLRGKEAKTETDRYFQEFLDNGGETGYTALHNVDEYKRMIGKELNRLNRKADYLKAVRTAGEWFSNMNRWAEDVARFNAYLTSRQMGRTITEAVNDAKEITVNFNKKGAGYKTGGLFGFTAGASRNLYLFFNAAVQSLNNFSKLARKNRAGFLTLLGGFASAGFLVPLLNGILMSADGDDEDYYANLPEWTRRNNLCLYIGGGRFLTVPLPIELRAFYGLGEMAYQATAGKDKYASENVAYAAINQITELLPINPLGNNGDLVTTFMPDALKPFWSIHTNKDFTGKPIYRKNAFNEKMPEHTKAYKSTADWLVDLSEWTNELAGGNKYRRAKYLEPVANWNPAKVEYLFESYFGGMATTVNQTGKTLAGLVKTSIDGNFTENVQTRSMPVLNRFLNNASDDRSRFAGINKLYYSYYDLYEDVAKDYRGYNNEVARGNFEYLEELKSLIESDEFKVYQIFKSGKSQIDKINKAEKMLPEASEKERKELEKMTADLKKMVVDSIQEELKE